VAALQEWPCFSVLLSGLRPGGALDGFRTPVGAKDFSILQRIPALLWPPPNFLFGGYRGLFPLAEMAAACN
jgi:hypothetical protein